MAEIIPAINAETFDQVKRQIKMLESYIDFVDGSTKPANDGITPAVGGVNWLHLDVADGTFTPNTLWHNAEDLLTLDTKLNIEVHLMISDIDTRFTQWLLGPVKRVIFHLEAGHDLMFVCEKIKEAGKEVGVGILPETDWGETKPFWSKVDSILLLSVSPGFAGQGMHPNTISKIEGLHQACPSCIIEIDGGVNKENAGKLVRAGASQLVSASAIFSNKNGIARAIENLKKEVI